MPQPVWHSFSCLSPTCCHCHHHHLYDKVTRLSAFIYQIMKETHVAVFLALKQSSAPAFLLLWWFSQTYRCVLISRVNIDCYCYNRNCYTDYSLEEQSQLWEIDTLCSLTITLFIFCKEMCHSHNNNESNKSLHFSGLRCSLLRHKVVSNKQDHLEWKSIIIFSQIVRFSS